MKGVAVILTLGLLLVSSLVSADEDDIEVDDVGDAYQSADEGDVIVKRMSNWQHEALLKKICFYSCRSKYEVEECDYNCNWKTSAKPKSKKKGITWGDAKLQ